MIEKRKGGIHRRSKFSSLVQEKQLQNKKNKEDDEICLNIVVKGIYSNNKKKYWEVHFLIA